MKTYLRELRTGVKTFIDFAFVQEERSRDYWDKKVNSYRPGGNHELSLRQLCMVRNVGCPERYVSKH